MNSKKRLSFFLEKCRSNSVTLWAFFYLLFPTAKIHKFFNFLWALVFFFKIQFSNGFFVFTVRIAAHWPCLFSFRMVSCDCLLAQVLQSANDSMAVYHHNPVANCALFCQLVELFFHSGFAYYKACCKPAEARFFEKRSSNKI